jgi:mRNA interferase RelE/StbE
MGKYRVLLRKSAAGELSRIPKKDLLRILERIRLLEEEARPQGREKLSAQERYRVRRGDDRIVYSIDDEKRTIDIFKIGHRSELYRS